MRRVAAALGVGTMSLYYYVQTKDELLDLMSDAIMGEVLVPDTELPTDWRGALEAVALRSLGAFRRHPWALTGPPTTPGPNAMRHFEQSMAAVASLKADIATKFEIVTMVDDYVFGFALRDAQDTHEREQHKDRPIDAIVAYFESQIATGQFPYLEQLAAGQDVRGLLERLDELGRDQSRFARGLTRLLDGIALELDSTVAPPAPSRSMRSRS